MAKPKPTGLIAAAARTATTLTIEEQALSSAAIDTFTKAIGGREALVDLLSVASDAPDVDKIVTLLCEERYATYSLRSICEMSGLTVADLFSALKKAAIVRAHVLAYMTQIAPKLVGVVKDVMERAQPYQVPCTSCGGLGTITAEPTKEKPNPTPSPCETCRGGGVLLAMPDLDRQKVALELGQLVVKSGGPLVALQQNFPAGASGSTAPGALEQMQQAVSELLFKSPARRSPAPPIDLEITDVPPGAP